MFVYRVKQESESGRITFSKGVKEIKVRKANLRTGMWSELPLATKMIFSVTKLLVFHFPQH